jgi:dUTP pyrophosphatase
MGDEKVTDIKIGFKYVGGKACPPIFKDEGHYYLSIFAPEDIPMPPGQTAVVKSGVAIEVPAGVEAVVHQSPELIGRRMGIMNSGAAIEAGLHEVVLIVVSQNQLIQTINQGEEIARLAFVKLLSADTKPILEMA